MPARELITGVLDLEITRLYAWTRDYVYAHEARPIVTEAACQLLFSAATGGATENGPYAFMVKSVRQQLLAAFDGNPFYFPPSAHLAVPLPNDQELEELCWVYGLVQAATSDPTIALGELYSLLRYLLDHYGFQVRSEALTGAFSSGAVGRQVEVYLLELIDRILHVRGDLFTMARAFADRERARSAEWLRNLPLQRRS